MAKLETLVVFDILIFQQLNNTFPRLRRYCAWSNWADPFKFFFENFVFQRMWTNIANNSLSENKNFRLKKMLFKKLKLNNHMFFVVCVISYYNVSRLMWCPAYCDHVPFIKQNHRLFLSIGYCDQNKRS